MKKCVVLIALLIVIISSGFVLAAEGDEDAAWNITYSSGGMSLDFAFSVDTDSGNNVYVVGTGRDLIGSSYYDWWIRKYNSVGTEIAAGWNKSFDGGGSDVAYIVKVDSSDSVYIAGKGQNIIRADSLDDVWIKKFNSAGTEQWEVQFSGSGRGDDIAYSIDFDSSGNVYVAGSGRDLIDDWSDYDGWVRKFSSAGVEIATGWNKTLDSGYSDTIREVLVDGSDNVYVVGTGEYLVSGTSRHDWWVKKYNSAGTEQFDLSFDGGNNGPDVAFAGILDSNDDLYVGGYTTGNTGSTADWDWTMKKIYSNGTEDDKHWDKTYDMNNGESIMDIEVDSNDNIYFTGYGSDLVGSSGNDWWVRKFNATGGQDVTNWNMTFSSAGGGVDISYGVAVDTADFVYLVGTGDDLVSGTSGSDWWIRKFEGGSTASMVVAGIIFLPLSFGSPLSMVLGGEESIGFGLGGENHTLTADSVGADSTTITVQSDPITFVLGIGERIKLDIDYDGVRDIIVRLVGIEEGIANIFVGSTSNRLRANDVIKLEIKSLKNEIRELRAEKKLLKGKKNREERKEIRKQIRLLRKEIKILRE